MLSRMRKYNTEKTEGLLEQSLLFYFSIYDVIISTAPSMPNRSITDMMIKIQVSSNLVP